MTVHPVGEGGGGLVACPPRKVLNFRPSEITSGSIFGFQVSLRSPFVVYSLC